MLFEFGSTRGSEEDAGDERMNSGDAIQFYHGHQCPSHQSQLPAYRIRRIVMIGSHKDPAHKHHAHALDFVPFYHQMS